VLAGGRLVTPYVHRFTLVDPLRRTFVTHPESRVPIRWLRGGHLLVSSDPDAPVLLLGADALGRDVFSRLVTGARVSLAIAIASVAAALAAGLAAGVIAGYLGGAVDRALMRLADFAVVLPVLYVVLALRATLPVVLPAFVTAIVMVVVFALVGWPFVARGVRAIVAAERSREYVVAAQALGAGPSRIMVRHLAPAAFGFARTQGLLLLPMFVIAEATLSFAGLGLPDAAPGWGTLLQDAANLGALGSAPWLLAPAVALFTLVLGVNLAFERSGRRAAADTRARRRRADRTISTVQTV
jgi:peptide/nickel transport system permease protein